MKERERRNGEEKGVKTVYVVKIYTKKVTEKNEDDGGRVEEKEYKKYWIHRKK